MDRIIKSFLDKFVKDFEIENTKETTCFEYFCNYVIAQHELTESFDYQDVNIGDNDTCGIDGFILTINGHLIKTKDEIEDIAGSIMKCNTWSSRKEPVNLSDYGKEIPAFEH